MRSKKKNYFVIEDEGEGESFHTSKVNWNNLAGLKDRERQENVYVEAEKNLQKKKKKKARNVIQSQVSISNLNPARNRESENKKRKKNPLSHHLKKLTKRGLSSLTTTERAKSLSHQSQRKLVPGTSHGRLKQENLPKIRIAWWLILEDRIISTTTMSES